MERYLSPICLEKAFRFALQVVKPLRHTFNLAETHFGLMFLHIIATVDKLWEFFAAYVVGIKLELLL